MILQGITIMAVGMTAVFSFLIILVFTLKYASRLILLWDKKYPSKENLKAPPPGKIVEEEKIAAVIGAIAAFDLSALKGMLKTGQNTGVSQAPGSTGTAPVIAAPFQTAAPAQAAAAWSLSGRQSIMRIRSLIQRGVLKRRE